MANDGILGDFMGKAMFVMVCSHVSFATVGVELTGLDLKLVKSLLYLVL